MKRIWASNYVKLFVAYVIIIFFWGLGMASVNLRQELSMEEKLIGGFYFLRVFLPFGIIVSFVAVAGIYIATQIKRLFVLAVAFIWEVKSIS